MRTPAATPIRPQDDQNEGLVPFHSTMSFPNYVISHYFSVIPADYVIPTDYVIPDTSNRAQAGILYRRRDSYRRHIPRSRYIGPIRRTAPLSGLHAVGDDKAKRWMLIHYPSEHHQNIATPPRFLYPSRPVGYCYFIQLKIEFWRGVRVV